MRKNTKILLIISGILLLLVLIISGWEANRKASTKINLKMPNKVVVPTRVAEKYTTDTGAIYISPTENQYVEEKLIADLRNKCPITTEAFKIDFDYQKNLFIVQVKSPIDSNGKLFDQWMKAAGYDVISPQYFKKI